ncbi:MAG: hypothetical protein [Circular genetic element sp.]|jgi:hypothetical protein|nr:MAG: hypothetical protein [Circular genetic element sp.]
MTIKTFRGLLADGAQERIRLETLDGKQGYRIKKLVTIPYSPGTTGIESVIKIYSIKQTTIDVLVNFSEQTLLGVSYYQDDANIAYPSSQDIIFDRVVFNQDIFITLKQNAGSHSMNYYLELEKIKLDDVEATAVILKNFRNTNTV